MWSFVHVVDAAAATVAAAEHGARGIYHVVDDEPAPLAEWLPAIAAAIGAPRRGTSRLARPAAGRRGGRDLMTEARGASNAKAQRELGWEPRIRAGGRGFPRRSRERRSRDAPGPSCGRVRSRSPTGCSGASSDAEDVVQEALLRVHPHSSRGSGSSRLAPTAATVVTRLAIDQLRSARVRRERYVGEWLPEPIWRRATPRPGEEAELADSLSLAFLVVLERLT